MRINYSILATSIVLFVVGVTTVLSPAAAQSDDSSPASSVPSSLHMPLMDLSCSQNPNEGRVTGDTITCFGGFYGANDVADIFKYNIVMENPDEERTYVSGDDFLGNTIPELDKPMRGLSCDDDRFGNITCFNGFEYPMGGATDEYFTYDPEKETFLDSEPAHTGKTKFNRSAHECLYANETYYCIGGYEKDPDISTFHRYVTMITEKNTESTEENMVDSGMDLTDALSGGRADLSCTFVPQHSIYCFGGFNRNGHHNDIIRINVSEDARTVENAGSLDEPRSSLECEYAQDGTIYCLGGYNENDGISKEIIAYDPEEETVDDEDLPDLPNGLAFSSCTEDTSSETRGSNIFCFGGYNGSHIVDTIYKFDYETEAPRITCDSCIEPNSVTVGEDIEIAPTIESRTDTDIASVLYCSSSACSTDTEASIICEETSQSTCTFTRDDYTETGVWVRATDRLGNSQLKRIGSAQFLLQGNAVCSEDSQCLSGTCTEGRCGTDLEPPELRLFR